MGINRADFKHRKYLLTILITEKKQINEEKGFDVFVFGISNKCVYTK